MRLGETRKDRRKREKLEERRKKGTEMRMLGVVWGCGGCRRSVVMGEKKRNWQRTKTKR